jgi:nickel/cobalt exporter
MMQLRQTSLRRSVATILLAALTLLVTTFVTSAHPLGNFTINRYTRLEISADRASLRYVIDMAEIPAFQELRAADTDNDGTTSSAELDAYLQRVAPQYANGLMVSVDGARVLFELKGKAISTPPGAGGLSTLRLECDFEGAMPQGDLSAAHRLYYEDRNDNDRTGWREIVVVPASGMSVFNSSAFANGVTDEIKAYPEDRLQAPLAERTAEFTFTRGAVPSGAQVLRTREGRPFVQEQRDGFSELIAIKELTPALALLGLLIAIALGAVHALSPGHGKTIVGAYLIGSRGTARHAVFLGLTVTVTHTIGVFALGIVTLFASQYVLPERLFPVLGLVSGVLVFIVGLSLFVRRLRAALKRTAHDENHYHDHAQHDHDHTHDDGHEHSHAHLHEHDHSHDHAHAHSPSHEHTHSHGGSSHTHLPPGVDGERVTWRSLLALGISGGLLPCPSALVVMLSAIAWHRVAYGLILVVAFSFGLACTLTCIGLAFVYAGRLMKGRINANGRALRWLPAMSAFVIACLGAVICYQALVEAGIFRSRL